MNSEHQADPRFVEFLEWQLGTEVRRAGAFAPADVPGAGPGARRPGSNRKGIKMLAFIAAMIIAMGVGAAGTYSVVQVESARQRELLVIKAEIRMEQATVRLEQQVEALERMMPLYEQGMIGESEIDTVRQDILAAEAEVEGRTLDLQETRITGAAPRDDLAAPVVEDRDFVAARLEVRMRVLRGAVETQTKVLAVTRQLYENGYIPDGDLEHEKHRLAQAEARVEALTRRLELRRSFLAGTLTAVEVELHDLARAAAAEMEDATLALEAAEGITERLTLHYEHGVITSSELHAAQAAVRTAEARLKLARLEVRIIEERLGAAERP